MLQASILDCETFDPFSLHEDFTAAPEVDVGGREIVQALVIATMVIVLDESANFCIQIAGKIIVIQQDAVLERLMPAFDLALRLRMQRRAAHMFDVTLTEPFREIARDVGWAIV